MDRSILSTQSWAEVIGQDVYGVRTLTVQPDVIYDLGAQVGMFTLLAATHCPGATVVAIEPLNLNYALLRGAVQCLPNVMSIPAALGQGQVFCTVSNPMGGETHGFLTEARYPLETLQTRADLYPVGVDTLTLTDITRLCPGNRTFFKIDVEGEEEAFILGDMDDAPLREAHYVAIELHSSGAPDGRGAKIADWIESFRTTHDVRERRNEGGIGGMLWMTKRIPRGT
jgi:FkbM family methyltransferase